MNKDKVIYELIFDVNAYGDIEDYHYQTTISSYGFYSDDRFEQRGFDPDDLSNDPDLILGYLKESELEY